METESVPSQRALKAYNKRVREDNERFQAMTPSRKRIEIARDVLRQIKIGRIVPETGTYMSPTFSKPENYSRDTEVSSLIERAESCNACALGAVFMCTVQRMDRLKVGFGGHTSDFYVSSHKMRDYLEEFFSPEQILLIELAFEGGVIDMSDMRIASPGFKREDYRVAKKYNKGVRDAKLRMENIMRNIERHGGRFEPSDTSMVRFSVEG